MEKLYMGTCSWKYDSWEGLVYNNPLRKNYLQEYSQYYNTVEIDQWFWSLHSIDKISLPKEKDAAEYAESVPDNFRFTIKVPNSLTLTHLYRKSKSEPLQKNPHFLSPDLFEEFTQKIGTMKEKIGVLMFQFEYLNKEKMSGLLEFIERFGSFLQNINTEYQLGIELRNPNYLNKRYFEFIYEKNITPILIHGYYMPPVWEIFKMIKINTKVPIVIRLHGPDRKGIEAKTNNVWNGIVEPKDAELEKISKMILLLQNLDVEVYVNVNNHYEGSAPKTIERLKKKI